MDEPSLTLDEALEQIVIERSDDAVLEVVDRLDGAVIEQTPIEQVARRLRLRWAQVVSTVPLPAVHVGRRQWPGRSTRWATDDVLAALAAAWEGLGPGVELVLLTDRGRSVGLEVAVDRVRIELLALRSDVLTERQVDRLDRHCRLSAGQRGLVVEAMTRFDDLVSESDPQQLPEVAVRRRDAAGVASGICWWRRVEITRRPWESAEVTTLLALVRRFVADAERDARRVERAGDVLVRSLVDLVGAGATAEALDERVVDHAAEVIRRWPCRAVL